jgi:hypothetical protein
VGSIPTAGIILRRFSDGAQQLILLQLCGARGLALGWHLVIVAERSGRDHGTPRQRSLSRNCIVKRSVNPFRYQLREKPYLKLSLGADVVRLLFGILQEHSSLDPTLDGRPN